MKKIILLYLSVLSIRLNAQSFSLSGVITFMDNSKWIPKIYLLKINTIDNFFSGSVMNVVDSALIDAKGHFEFSDSTVIEDNCFYRLNFIPVESDGNGGAIYMGGLRENFVFLLLHKNSQIKLITEADKFADKLILTKSDKPNYLICKLNKLRTAENYLLDTLLSRKKSLDPSLISFSDSLRKINELIVNSGYITNTYEHIKTFADTVSNPYISLLASNFLPSNSYKSFLATLSAQYQKEIPASKYAAQFKAKIDGEQMSLKVGTKAPAISLPDQNGKAFDFSTLSGKYVLIDFWASWCSPCRRENTENIKPLYEKYKDKGFIVLSVSQDIDKTAWLNAVNKDGIYMWNHVSDLKGQASPIVNEYKVSYLPYNILIDRQGMIIAQNLTGIDLEKYLIKLFK